MELIWSRKLSTQSPWEPQFSGVFLVSPPVSRFSAVSRSPGRKAGLKINDTQEVKTMQENLHQALRAERATDRYFRYSFDENITPSAGIVEKSGRC